MFADDFRMAARLLASRRCAGTSNFIRAMLFRVIGFNEDNAIKLVVSIAGRPVILDSFDFESSTSQFADKNLLWYAMAAAVCGNAFGNRGALGRNFVDDRQSASGF